MSRGSLDDSTLAKISEELPNQEDLQETVLSLTPDFISMKFKPESSVPVAAVCLQDAAHTLSQAQYALHEYFAHKIWYLEKEEPPSKAAAAFFCRFYADDVALRLYSAGEHLANAIISMLEITEQRLKSYRDSRRISLQSIVGNLLAKEEPQHPITEAVVKLATSKEWHDTIEYRNIWVHEQPPTIEDLGIVYKRFKRWRVSDAGKGHALGIGGGDEPEYSADELVQFIQPALFQFADAMAVVIASYIELLESRGITVSQGKYKLQVRFFNRNT